MTIAALPTLYDLDEPTTNLAWLDAQPEPTQYQAWDGTSIGEGNTCAPMRYNEGMMGVMPDFIENRRITFGSDIALPVLLGALSYFSKRAPGRAALWGLAAYMAPLPAAGAFALAHIRDMGGGSDLFESRANRRVYTPRPQRRNWER